MVDVLVIRHAQSVWNQAGRWQGQADPPLSDLGAAEARAAAAALSGLDYVVASDLDRARSTAELMAEAMGVGPVEVDADWRERDAGAWQGLTRAEIERDYPGYLDGGRFPPGWEPDSSVLDRGLAALRRAADRAGGAGSGQALAVSHAGVIYALERHLDCEFERIDHLWGRWFTVDDGRIGCRPRVALTGRGAEPVAAQSR